MAKYQTEIPQEVNELLKAAAKRDGRSKERFIHKLFEKAAEKEQKLQDAE